MQRIEDRLQDSTVMSADLLCRSDIIPFDRIGTLILEKIT